MSQPTKKVNFLGGMSIETFLSEYWQKKPLFIKQAFPGFKDPISADEIAGLSCEEEIPSRIVFEEGGKHPWEMRRGPFKEEDFSQFPDQKWMLLINDLEKFMPQLKVLTNPLRFIPDWRLDDLQVSYATDHGNVGPHWDDYDVFLLQGRGKKKWQISYAPVSEEDFVEGLDIRLIEGFKADEEWIVESGDLLYLPPRIGHYGVAIGESITWSIGFRAPKHREMLESFTNDLIDFIPADLRYTDPDLIYQKHPAELTDEAIDKVTKILQNGLACNRELIADWFGRYMSESKSGQEPEVPEEAFTLEEIEGLLADETDIERHPSTRFYFRETLDEVILYTDGDCHELDKKHSNLIKMICEFDLYSPGKIRPFLKDRESAEFLLHLINSGYLYFFAQDDEDHEHAL